MLQLKYTQREYGVAKRKREEQVNPEATPPVSSRMRRREGCGAAEGEEIAIKESANVEFVFRRFQGRASLNGVRA